MPGNSLPFSATAGAANGAEAVDRSRPGAAFSRLRAFWTRSSARVRAHVFIRSRRTRQSRSLSLVDPFVLFARARRLFAETVRGVTCASVDAEILDSQAVCLRVESVSVRVFFYGACALFDLAACPAEKPLCVYLFLSVTAGWFLVVRARLRNCVLSAHSGSSFLSARAVRLMVGCTEV